MVLQSLREVGELSNVEWVIGGEDGEEKGRPLEEAAYIPSGYGYLVCRSDFPVVSVTCHNLTSRKICLFTLWFFRSTHTHTRIHSLRRHVDLFTAWPSTPLRPCRGASKGVKGRADQASGTNGTPVFILAQNHVCMQTAADLNGLPCGPRANVGRLHWFKVGDACGGRSCAGPSCSTARPGGAVLENV